MKNNLLLIAGLFLIACEKGELPIQPHDSGEELVNSVEMGPDYKQQLFFSLDKNEVISSNLKTDWNLAFETSDTGWHVRLNTAMGMSASRKTGTFESITDTTGAAWSWDAHSGNKDSTAFGDWQTYGGIYILDLGYNEAGVHQGFSKIQISSVSSTAYEVSYGDLTSTTPVAKTIAKNNAHSFMYFSLESGETVPVAPPADQWDLMFTQYTHIFENPTTPYLVTGVLLNPYTTSACFIDYINYTEITYDLAQSFNYSSQWNVIGYDWKYFDFAESLYLVDPTQIYVIKTQHDYYYKFHFVDFYNESGLKGYPKFEFNRL
jgi:hypothetical protein